MMEIKIRHRIFTSSGHKMLEVDQYIEEGSFVCISGDSGIGKTTFFRIVAGVTSPDFGYIKTEDKILLDTGSKIFLSPQRRNVAIMFQNYALFPNMTVKQNIAFAQKNEDEIFVENILQKFDLKLLADAFPARLSGGQQQRVALARTLAQKAEIILLDEPLSAVDPSMRKILREEIIKYHRSNDCTFFVISHNEEEFKEFCDYNLVIK